ncbi:MAG: hypothetical protein IKB05_03760 [Alphaproteobacteria bacterium]|nr:hypothetical protein [Alphaproteobacteria bacterium]
MRKFLFIITVIVFPTVSFSDIASTAYVDKNMEAMENGFLEFIPKLQGAINPTEKCDLVCADDACSYYKMDCNPIPDEERAHNTFVIIDKYGYAIPSEIADDGNGEFITGISVTDTAVVVTRSDAPMPQVATRESAGIVKMGEIPVGTSGTESAMMWIE